MEAVKSINGLPLLDHRLGGEKVRPYLDFFQRRVIGQRRAIELLVGMKLRYNAGLADKNGPAGIAALFGPSGVGKTYLAKVFAELLFGDPTALTIVAGQEYHDQHTVSRLTGSPPGYLGFFNKKDKDHPGVPPAFSQEVLYLNTVNGMKRGLKLAEEEVAALEKAGALGSNASTADTEKQLQLKVERLKATLEKFKNVEDPSDIPSIVLIDEIEKMHPDVRPIFLTAFNEGMIVLPNNDTTSFRNTFFIITGNIAEKEITKLGSGGKMGFASSAGAKSKRESNSNVWKVLKPELLRVLGAPLLGRIGNKRIVSCDLLGIGEQLQIFDLPLGELQRKLSYYEKPCRLEVDDAVKRYLVGEIDPVLGARSLTDLIEAWIERPLIALLLKNEAEGGLVANDVVRAILALKDGADGDAKEVRFVLVSRGGK